MFLPAWLAHVRQLSEQAGTAEVAASADVDPGFALWEGLRRSLDEARDALQKGEHTRASRRLDAALRAAEVGAHSAPGAFYSALEQIRDARLAVQDGQTDDAVHHIEHASKDAEPAMHAQPPDLDVHGYDGAEVISPRGAIIGEVVGVSSGSVTVAIGGWRDAWGFLDFGGGRHRRVPVGALAFGPPRKIGLNLVSFAGGAPR